MSDAAEARSSSSFCWMPGGSPAGFSRGSSKICNCLPCATMASVSGTTTSARFTPRRIASLNSISAPATSALASRALPSSRWTESWLLSTCSEFFNWMMAPG